MENNAVYSKELIFRIRMIIYVNLTSYKLNIIINVIISFIFLVMISIYEMVIIGQETIN